MRYFLMVYLYLFMGIANAQESVFDLLRNEPKNDTLVVFVHGVRSSSEDAWTNNRTGTFWPQLIIDDSRLEFVNVATFGYPAGAFSRDGLTINQVGTNLSVFLKPQMMRHRSVVFIAHSMGGLVVRSMLLNERDAFPSPLAFFLGTPTAGSDLPKLLQALGIDQNNALLEGMKPLQQNNFLEAQISQWAGWQGSGKPRVLCAFERVRTNGVFVVEQQQMLPGCDDIPLGVSANHSQLPKPSGEGSLVHEFLVTALLSLDQALFKPKLENIIRLPRGLTASERVLVADTVSLEADTVLPTNSVVIATNLQLNGFTLFGRDLTILAETIADGTVRALTEPQTGDAGEVVIAARRLSGVEVFARGAAGSPGRDGAPGSSHGRAPSGRDGNCDGFGGYRGAQAGDDGIDGGAGEDGGDGLSGGDGGRVFVATVLQGGFVVDVTEGTGGPAGRGGRGGKGGQGGAGGRGCVGLGGSQSNASDGRDGVDGPDGLDGRHGAPGAPGAVWHAELDTLQDLPVLADLPRSDLLYDYAGVISEDIRQQVRLAAQQ